MTEDGSVAVDVSSLGSRDSNVGFPEY